MSSGMSTMKSTTAPYHTMVVMRSAFQLSRFDRWAPLPRFDTQICVFEQSVIALEIIGFSTADVVDFIDKILDIGGDILLDPRKHDQLLFDDDSFSRSRKYWWASNLLVPLRQNVENNCKVHQQLFDDLIVPIIGIPTSVASRDTSEWPNGLAEVEERATVAYKSLEELLDRIDFQQKRVAALRDGVSICSKGFAAAYVSEIANSYSMLVGSWKAEHQDVWAK
jgi:hypothetical protein